MSTRKSNIELLRIIAILLICISHFIPHYGDATAAYYVNVDIATADFQKLIICFFSYFGSIGNCIFVVCSAYFLADSAKLKFEKVTRMIADVFFFSVLSLLIYLLRGFPISKINIVKSFIPLTSGKNWFIPCYLIYYCIHPLLNKAVEGMSKRKMQFFISALLVIYGIAQFFGNLYYYTSLVGFVMIHYVVVYMKQYGQQLMSNKKKNIVLLSLSIFALVALFFLTNLIGLKIPALSNQISRWCGFNNILIVGIAIFMFNLFQRLEMYSNILNTVASYSLLIYIITEDYFFRVYDKPLFWNWYYNKFTYSNLVLGVIVVAVVSFLSALFLAHIYSKTIRKYWQKIVNKVINFFVKFFICFIDKLGI